MDGRWEHTATLLTTGKVLVVGGDGQFNTLSSAEVYDPVANDWSALASMTIGRSQHTATLLADGKVLVVGDGAELYDPISNTWSAAGTLATPRSAHTATRLTNGKVLVVGGWGGDGLTSAELYDPSTNTWSAAASLAAGRFLHTATLLPSGKVLVAGGEDVFTTELSPEIYDPAADSWSPAGTATGRAYHTATLLSNGKVLVTGGRGDDDATYLHDTELYDPTLDAWTAGPSLATSRAAHTATLLANGKVLVAGGLGTPISGFNNTLESAEIYDPVTNAWSAAASMMTERLAHTGTLLPSGAVLVVGGTINGSQSLASSELYAPPPVATVGGSMTQPDRTALQSAVPSAGRQRARGIFAAAMAVFAAALVAKWSRRRA